MEGKKSHLNNLSLEAFSVIEENARQDMAKKSHLAPLSKMEGRKKYPFTH